MEPDINERLSQIFFSTTVERISEGRKNAMRFVHYTSAENAMRILDTGGILLRNSNLMNDFSEVRHGLSCLQMAYRSPAGERLVDILKSFNEELPQIVERNFDNLYQGIQSETYLTSISEHGDPTGKDGHEDHFGRLSMWRAYAEKNGVALILNNTAILSDTNALNAFSSPVLYAMPEDFTSGQFARVVKSIEDNIEFLREISPDSVQNMLQDVFLFAVQSTKHPSFREEREWRIIYSPQLLQQQGVLTEEQNRRVPTEIMTLGGVPQRVYKIPFKNYPDEGFVGVTIPELFHRILIGPSPDAYHIREAFVQCLKDVGVEDAVARVQVTNIPLRT